MGAWTLSDEKCSITCVGVSLIKSSTLINVRETFNRLNRVSVSPLHRAPSQITTIINALQPCIQNNLLSIKTVRFNTYVHMYEFHLFHACPKEPNQKSAQSVTSSSTSHTFFYTIRNTTTQQH